MTTSNKVKNAILSGETIERNAWSIHVDNDDHVVIFPPKGAGFKTSLANIDRAVKDFCKKAEMPIPGVKTSHPPKDVSDPDLGKDTTTNSPFTVPKVNTQDDVQGQFSSPTLGPDSSTKKPFNDPSVIKRQPVEELTGGLPDTELGEDSSGKEPNFHDHKVTIQEDGRVSGRRIRAFDYDRNFDHLKDLLAEDLASGDLQRYQRARSIYDGLSPEHKAVLDDLVDIIYVGYPTSSISDEEQDAYLKDSPFERISTIQEDDTRGASRTLRIQDTFSQEKTPDIYSKLSKQGPSAQLLEDIMDPEKWTANNFAAVAQYYHGGDLDRDMSDPYRQNNNTPALVGYDPEARDSFSSDDVDAGCHGPAKKKKSLRRRGEGFNPSKKTETKPEVSDVDLTDSAEDSDRKAELDEATDYAFREAKAGGRWDGGSADELARMLQGVVILSGAETYVDLPSDYDDPVYVAVVHDSSGYTPGAAIAVTSRSADEAIQAAVEDLEQTLIDSLSPEEQKEMWDTEENEGFNPVTEGIDGRVFTLQIPELKKMLLSLDHFNAERISKILKEIEDMERFIDEDQDMEVERLEDKIDADYDSEYNPAMNDEMEDDAMKIKSRKQLRQRIARRRASNWRRFAQGWNLEISPEEAAVEQLMTMGYDAAMASALVSAYASGQELDPESAQAVEKAMQSSQVPMGVAARIKYAALSNADKSEDAPVETADPALRGARKIKAGPKLKEKWDEAGGYNRDMEAESAEELYHLVRSFGSEDPYDWSSYKPQMPVAPEGVEQGNAAGEKFEGDDGLGGAQAKRKVKAGDWDNPAELEIVNEWLFGDKAKAVSLAVDAGPEEIMNVVEALPEEEQVEFWEKCNSGIGQFQANKKVRKLRAVDDKAKKYWKDYFKEYGAELVDAEPKKRGPKSEKKESRRQAIRNRVKVNISKRAQQRLAQEAMNPATIPGGQNALAGAPMADAGPPAPAQAGTPAPRASAPAKPAGGAPKGGEIPPGSGDSGLQALGWTMEEIQVMTPEEKQKILQIKLNKPGTKPKAPASPAPAQGAPAKPAPKAPASPAPAPVPASPAPVEARIMAKRLENKLKIRLAQMDLEAPPMQAPQPTSPVPGAAETPSTATTPTSDSVDMSQMGSSEGKAFQILQEVRQQEVNATDSVGVAIAKNKLLAQRLMTEAGMTLDEAKKLFGIQNMLKLFQ